MIQTQDVHKQFAQYFKNKKLEPFFYLLSKKFEEGHICINLNEIDRAELVEAGYPYLIGKEELAQEELVSTAIDQWQPLFLWKDFLYLQRYFSYENQVYHRILEFVQTEKDIVLTDSLRDLKTKVKQLFPADELGQPDWQLIAALSAFLNQFNIITGGPGTGKTTTVAKILSLLLHQQPDLKIALAAPTGKAAARMAESLKEVAHNPLLNLNPQTIALFEALEPATLHRLLKSRPGEIHFKHNRENPLPHDVLIIDESSMIDIALFAKLLDAISSKTKVIFLGDKDQLASVEAGSLFGDLCTALPKLNQFSTNRAHLFNEIMSAEKTPIGSNHISSSPHPLFEHVIELQHSYRFAAGGNIGKLSRAIIQNNEKEIHYFLGNTESDIYIDAQYEEKELINFAKNFEEYVKAKDLKTAFQKLNEFRILCATREGPEGLYATNRKIEAYLQSRNLLSISGAFYEHRPIIVSSNNYELGLYNGDIGITERDAQGKLKVWFETPEGGYKAILPAYIPSAETVFAMTIHKSQGSEFDHVFVRLPNYADNQLLTRELLYTAVTRAKKTVSIQASEAVLLQTCARKVKRGSGIAQRFIEKL